MSYDQFNRGDRVINANRPEWGDGVVDQAVVIHHEGKAAQKLVVRFANRGRVTINTAVANVRPADQGFGNASSTDGGWLNALEGNNPNQPAHASLGKLPDDMTDIFLNLEARLRNTLESYRHRDDARGLIDWAVMITKLNDPLSEYTRHELEEAYKRFAHNRNQHLGELVKNAKQNGERHLLDTILREKLPPKGREALKKAIRH